MNKKAERDQEMIDAKTAAYAQGFKEGFNQALKQFGVWAMHNGISGAKVAQYQKETKKRD